VREPILRRRLLLHTGQPYSAIAVEQARKDLLVLGVFAAVSVHVGEAPDAQGRVSVIFQMQERLRHAVSLNAATRAILAAVRGHLDRSQCVRQRGAAQRIYSSDQSRRRHGDDRHRL